MSNCRHNQFLDALAIVVGEALDTENPSEFRISLDEHDDLLAFLSGLRTDICDECGDDLPYDGLTDSYLPCPDCNDDLLTSRQEFLDMLESLSTSEIKFVAVHEWTHARYAARLLTAYRKYIDENAAPSRGDT